MFTLEQCNLSNNEIDMSKEDLSILYKQLMNDPFNSKV